MSRIAIHYYIVLLYHSDATYLIIIPFALALTDVLLWMTVKLLALNNMTSQHLRIFNLNLWVIEYVVIIIDILNYLYRLVLILLFGL